MSEIFKSIPKGLSERAQKIFSAKNFSEAKKLQQDDTDGYKWLFLSAQEFLKLKEYKIAEHFFNETLKRQPHLIFGHAGLAVCRFHLDRIRESLDSMYRAISMLISYEMGEMEENGIEANIHQTSIPAKGIMFFNDKFAIGNASLSLLEIVKDENSPIDDEDFSNIVVPEALFHFGNFCRKKGRYDEAITSFRLSVKIKPNDSLSQTNLGTALGEMGDFQQALIELTKAIILNPNDAVAYSGLGIVYEEIGNIDNSIEYLSNAIKLRNGDYPFAEKNLERILTKIKHLNVIHTKKSVFLSYASEDKEFVLGLAEDLSKVGIDVWVDEWAILPGDSIVEKINLALKKNRFFVPILSKSFVSKPWPMYEMNSAMMKQATGNTKYIIPVMIEKCETPELIKDIKYADFIIDYQKGLKLLIAAISISKDK